MQVVFDDRQFGHAPKFYFRPCINIPHPEQPERARLLREIMFELGHDGIAPGDFGLNPIYAVHDPSYVDFFARPTTAGGSVQGIRTLPSLTTTRVGALAACQAGP